MKVINLRRFSFYYLFSSLLLIFQTACIQEDEFGLSPFKEIKTFELANQAGTTLINKENRTIVIPMSEGANLRDIVPDNIEISNFSTISPSKDLAQDFTNIINYKVTAEDGSVANWTVEAVAALPNPQLPNSNFDLWYNVGNYQQPGADANSTVWGTANRALAIAGDANTVAEDLGGGDFAAKLTTVSAPLLVRMAAATLFTGSFTTSFPNPTDPRSNIDFGIPFIGRPKSFKVDYKYIPGNSYEDANGNPLAGSDECDIYVLLEKREGNNIERIATAWFRDGASVNSFTTITFPFKYGQLTATDPEFAYANIRTSEGESWGNANDTPTHITVVFSSSALGDLFTGAIGSELTVNNFELIY